MPRIAARTVARQHPSLRNKDNFKLVDQAVMGSGLVAMSAGSRVYIVTGGLVREKSDGNNSGTATVPSTPAAARNPEDDAKTLELQSRVTCLAWTESGRHLVIGDEKGSLHFSNCLGTLLFSQSVEKKSVIGVSFVDSSTLALCTETKLMVFSRLDLQSLETAIIAGDKREASKVRRRTRIAQASLSQYHTPVKGICVGSWEGDGSTNSRIFVYGGEKDSDCSHVVSCWQMSKSGGGRKHHVEFSGGVKKETLGGRWVTSLKIMPGTRPVIVGLTDIVRDSELDGTSEGKSLRCWDAISMNPLAPYVPVPPGTVDIEPLSSISGPASADVNLESANNSAESSSRIVACLYSDNDDSSSSPKMNVDVVQLPLTTEEQEIAKETLVLFSSRAMRVESMSNIEGAVMVHRPQIDLGTGAQGNDVLTCVEVWISTSMSIIALRVNANHEAKTSNESPETEKSDLNQMQHQIPTSKDLISSAQLSVSDSELDGARSKIEMSSKDDLLLLLSETKHDDMIVASVVEECLCAHLSSLTDTRFILESANKRLMEIEGIHNNDARTSKLGNDMHVRLRRLHYLVKDASHRLKTFELMFLHELTSNGQNTTKGCWNSVLWHRFRVGNLRLAALAYAKKGQLRRLALVWARHRSTQYISQNRNQALTTNDVPALLSSLPIAAKDCDPVAYAKWVQTDIMPCVDCYSLGPGGINQKGLCGANAMDVVAKDSDVLAEVITWCIQRARAVERIDCRPHRALHVASIVDGTVWSRVNSLEEATTLEDCGGNQLVLKQPLLGFVASPSSLVQSMSLHGIFSSMFGRLQTLCSRLRELCHLHDAHPALSDTKLSLDQYEMEVNGSGAPQNVALALLDQCLDAREIPRCIVEHVQPCSAFLGLDVDSVLVEYVSELAQEMSHELKVPNPSSHKDKCATATNPRKPSEQPKLPIFKSALRRCLATIAHISSNSLRCSAALSILRHAVPPYEQALITLANRAELWALQAGGNPGIGASLHAGFHDKTGKGGGIEGDEGGSKVSGLAAGSGILGGLALEAGIIDIDGSMRDLSTPGGSMLQSAVREGGTAFRQHKQNVSVILSEIREHQSLMRLSDIRSRYYQKRGTSLVIGNQLDLADPEHAYLLMRKCCSDVDEKSRMCSLKKEHLEPSSAELGGRDSLSSVLPSGSFLDALLIVDAYHPLHRLNACSHYCLALGMAANEAVGGHSSLLHDPDRYLSSLKNVLSSLASGELFRLSQHYRYHRPATHTPSRYVTPSAPASTLTAAATAANLRDCLSVTRECVTFFVSNGYLDVAEKVISHVLVNILHKVRATGAVSKGGGGIRIHGAEVMDFLINPDYLKRVKTLRCLRDEFGVRIAGGIYQDFTSDALELSLHDLSKDSGSRGIERRLHALMSFCLTKMNNMESEEESIPRGHKRSNKVLHSGYRLADLLGVERSVVRTIVAHFRQQSRRRSEEARAMQEKKEIELRGGRYVPDLSISDHTKGIKDGYAYDTFFKKMLHIVLSHSRSENRPILESTSSTRQGYQGRNFRYSMDKHGSHVPSDDYANVLADAVCNCEDSCDSIEAAMRAWKTNDICTSLARLGKFNINATANDKSSIDRLTNSTASSFGDSSDDSDTEILQNQSLTLASFSSDLGYSQVVPPSLSPQRLFPELFEESCHVLTKVQVDELSKALGNTILHIGRPTSPSVNALNDSQVLDQKATMKAIRSLLQSECKQTALHIVSHMIAQTYGFGFSLGNSEQKTAEDVLSGLLSRLHLDMLSKTLRCRPWIDQELTISYMLSCKSRESAFNVYRSELPKLHHLINKSVSKGKGPTGLPSSRNIITSFKSELSSLFGDLLLRFVSLPREFKLPTHGINGTTVSESSVFLDSASLKRFHGIFRIGEIVGRVWGQEGLERQCKLLASNMDWWRVFTRLGCPFEPQRFNDDDYAEIVIADLVRICVYCDHRIQNGNQEVASGEIQHIKHDMYEKMHKSISAVEFERTALAFARHFRIDRESCLALHVESILLMRNDSTSQISSLVSMFPILTAQTVDSCRASISQISPEGAVLAIMSAVVKLPGIAHSRIKQCCDILLESLLKWDIDGQSEQHASPSGLSGSRIRNNRMRIEMGGDSINDKDNFDNNLDGDSDTPSLASIDSFEFEVYEIADIILETRAYLAILHCILRLTHYTNTNRITPRTGNQDVMLALDFHELVSHLHFPASNTMAPARGRANEGKRRSLLSWVAERNLNIPDNGSSDTDSSNRNDRAWREIRRHLMVNPPAGTDSITVQQMLNKDDTSVSHRQGANHKRGTMGINIFDPRRVLLLRTLCGMHLNLSQDKLALEFCRALIFASESRGRLDLQRGQYADDTPHSLTFQPTPFSCLAIHLRSISDHKMASEVASGLVDRGIITIDASNEEKTAAEAAIGSLESKRLNSDTNKMSWPLWSNREEPFQRHQAIHFAKRYAERWKRGLQRQLNRLQSEEKEYGSNLSQLKGKPKTLSRYDHQNTAQESRALTVLEEIYQRLRRCEKDIIDADRRVKLLASRTASEELNAKISRLCSHKMAFSSSFVSSDDAALAKDELLKLVRQGDARGIVKQLFLYFSSDAHRSKKYDDPRIFRRNSTVDSGSRHSEFADLLMDAIYCVVRYYASGILVPASAGKLNRTENHKRKSRPPTLDTAQIRHQLIRAWLLEPLEASAVTVGRRVAQYTIERHAQKRKRSQEGNAKDDALSGFSSMHSAFHTTWEEWVAAYEEDIVSKISFTLGASCTTVSTKTNDNSSHKEQDIQDLSTIVAADEDEFSDGMGGESDGSSESDNDGNDAASSFNRSHSKLHSSRHNSSASRLGGPAQRKRKPLVVPDRAMPLSSQLYFLLRFAMADVLGSLMNDEKKRSGFLVQSKVDTKASESGSSNATFWARGRAIKTCLSIAHLSTIEKVFYSHASDHDADDEEANVAVPSIASASTGREFARAVHNRVSLVGAFEAILTMCRFERLRLPHTFDQVNLGHAMLVQGSSLRMSWGLSAKRSTSKMEGGITDTNLRPPVLENAREFAARFAGLIGGLWRDYVESDYSSEMSSEDIVNLNLMNNDVEKLAAILSAGAASTTNDMETYVMPLERRSAAVSRLLAHLMVDQERRYRGSFEEHMPGLWEGILVRLHQQGQTRFLLKLLVDVVELSAGQDVRNECQQSMKGWHIFGGSYSSQINLATVWSSTIHAPLLQLLSGKEKVDSHEERNVLEQIVHLVEVVPAGIAYRNAVCPGHVCESLCLLYKRKKQLALLNLKSGESLAANSLESISWILNLSARAALATPGVNDSDKKVSACEQGVIRDKKLLKKMKKLKRLHKSLSKIGSQADAILLVVKCGGAVTLLQLLGSGGVVKDEAAAVSNSISIVFDCVDSAREYDALQNGAGGSFFRPFVKHLVAKGSVKGLLTHAVQHGRRQEALMLIKMWHITSAPRSELEAWKEAKNAERRLDEDESEKIENDGSEGPDLVNFTAKRLGIKVTPEPHKDVSLKPHFDNVHLDLDALKKRLSEMK